MNTIRMQYFSLMIKFLIITRYYSCDLEIPYESFISRVNGRETRNLVMIFVMKICIKILCVLKSRTYFSDMQIASTHFRLSYLLSTAWNTSRHFIPYMLFRVRLESQLMLICFRQIQIWFDLMKIGAISI